MKCSDIENTLLGDGAPRAWSAEHRAHLSGCESCRRLADVLAASPEAAVPVQPRSLREIERVLAADLHPVQGIASKRQFVALLLAIFVFFAGLGVLRLGSRGLTVMTAFQASVMLGALLIGAALLAWSLANQISPGSLHRLSPVSLPAAVTTTLSILAAALFHFEHEQEFWMRSWQCIRLGAPFSLLAAIPTWFVLRRGAFLSPRTIGLGAGLFTGLAGALAIQIRCQNLEAAHILVSHLGMAAVASGLGWLLGLAIEQAGTVLRRS
jgi:hypothetical protein